MDDREFRRPDKNHKNRAQDAFRRPDASQKSADSGRARPDKTAGARKTEGSGGFSALFSDAKKKMKGKSAEASGAKKKNTKKKNKEQAKAYDEAMSFTEKRRAYESERAEKQKRRRLARMRRNVRKRVSGKPDLPKGDITAPGMLGKFAGKITVLVIVILVAALVFAGGSGLGIVLGYITTATEVPTDLFTIKEQTSYVYDKDGKTIATLTGSSNINRELVRYEEVTSSYID